MRKTTAFLAFYLVLSVGVTPPLAVVIYMFKETLKTTRRSVQSPQRNISANATRRRDIFMTSRMRMFEFKETLSTHLWFAETTATFYVTLTSSTVSFSMNLRLQRQAEGEQSGLTETYIRWLIMQTEELQGHAEAAV